MSHTTNESDEILYLKDQTESSMLKKGPWTAAEDSILIDYVKIHGEGNWNAVQKHSGLSRCGKSCRLRWANHLRPNLKKGAFTEEEERLIIELHANMGNKWARMATHLPGRTDNEIKNYWNTRIKRRQRAGLPLYPPEFSLSQDNHNSYEGPDFIFDSLKPLPNQGISPYVPELPDITQSGFLIKGLGSSQFGSFISPVIHRHKRLRESTISLKDEFPLFEEFQDGSFDKAAQSFGFSFQGSHTLLNGDISKSNSEPVKSELPSIQYPENDFGLPESSPRNSGLLEALLYEAKTIGSAKNHFSDKSSNSSSVTPSELAESSALNFCGNTEWEEYGDPIFSECTPMSASGSSLEEAHPAETFSGYIMKSELVDQAWSPEREVETGIQLDSTRPDALLSSDWLGQGSGYTKDQVIISDNIATLLGDDLSSDYKQMSTNQGLGLSSCVWNAMPAVCQIPELP